MRIGQSFELGVTQAYLDADFQFSASSVSNNARGRHSTLDGLLSDTYSVLIPINGGLKTPPWGLLGATGVAFYYICDDPNLLPVAHFYFESIGAFQLEVRIIQTGFVQIAMDGGTVVATSAFPINASVGHWFDCFGTFQTVGGEIHVYCDGVEILTYLGDTQSAAGSGWDRMHFFAQPGFFFVNDLIAHDGLVAISEKWCGVSRPSGDVTVAGLTPTPAQAPGSFYLNISDNPGSTASYLEATAANTNLFDHTALPVAISPGSVEVVSVYTWMGRDGLLTTGETRVVSGAADVFTTPAVVLPAAPNFGLVGLHLELNPDGAVAWTTASINASQFGSRGA